MASFIPPRIKGRLHALMSYIRMLFIVLYFVFSFAKFDLVVVDQITLPIPILRLFKYKVLYYCHFPEALLNDNKRTFLVVIYRKIIDTIEILCMYLANVICFNSEYTRSSLEATFPSMRKWKGGKYIVYPCMQAPPAKVMPQPQLNSLISPKEYLLTVNRFETRKRLDLCLEAFALAIKKCEKLRNDQNFKLVLAGGLDAKNADALVCRRELADLAKKLQIDHRVVMRENITQEEKEYLLSNSYLFLYTPPNEHFGIGPIEAMIRSVPAVGINNGGPKETIENGETGFLLRSDPAEWSDCIVDMVSGLIYLD